MPYKNKHVKNIVAALQQQINQAFAWPSAPEPGKPYLTERDGILSLHFDKLSIQSEMHLDEPDELIIGYTRTAMSFLLFEPSPKRVAMIGLGGGSLAKYCYRYLPQSEIIVIEINPDVIALRNEFAIPPDDDRFKIVQEDGADWLEQTQWQPDALIVDGFDAAGLPLQLSSQHFYDDCYTSLADNGVMAVNLWGGYPHYDEYLARIHTSFSDQVIVVDAEDSVNKIVIAVKSDSYPPTPSEIRHHAKLLCLSHSLNFHKKSARLIRALSLSN